MPRKKRPTSTFNLSFLDIMSCGFGAVVLVFLIIDHSMEVQSQTLNATVYAEVDLLEQDIREGQAGLVALRNALDSQDAAIVEAQGRASRVTEELDRYEAMIRSIEEDGFTEEADIDALKAEINRLEQQVEELKAASDAESGRSAREFTGDGNRQYLTGLNLGGNHILILLDVSSSMLSDSLVNVIRLRNMDESMQRNAPKWVRALDTVDWLTAQLPVSARYQVLAFNTQVGSALESSGGSWLEVADTASLTRLSESLRTRLPAGGTSLHAAFSAAAAMNPKPDNIILITDGLPTQGDKPPRKTTVSANERLNLYRSALRQLPTGVPVSIILGPMEGDPLAATEFWQLARATGGSFMSPSQDWP
jgi:hypothetical protein